jgi:hypothetical protein
MLLVLDDPLDRLAALKLHGPSDGGGNVDVPLLRLLAIDELNLRQRPHGISSSEPTPGGYLVIQLDITNAQTPQARRETDGIN